MYTTDIREHARSLDIGFERHRTFKPIDIRENVGRSHQRAVPALALTVRRSSRIASGALEGFIVASFAFAGSQLHLEVGGDINLLVYRHAIVILFRDPLKFGARSPLSPSAAQTTKETPIHWRGPCLVEATVVTSIRSDESKFF